MDPNNNNNNIVNPNALNAPNMPKQPRRTLGSYIAPSPAFYGNNIVVPPMAANNFELKPQLIALVQKKFDTVSNPRKECKAIHLRSGKVTCSKAKVSEEPVEKKAPKKAKSQEEYTLPRHPNNPLPVDLEQYLAKPKAPEYKPKMAYPQRLQKASKDKRFSILLEVFKKLQINIPFVEALEQMPLYAKFIKELLTNKRIGRRVKPWCLQRNVVLLFRRISPRICKILEINEVKSTIQRALCDLVASINLMTLSLMRKL
ncbi:uncharacterized protein LOC130966641 [Arachis stenosperma]|uniref:uncharacterized protein LOC130966641 n=1 Tax=Arachis stenosperma TaxID=217475 RepID=UPI0025AB91ED|nr:uncharacterized protein LOC130966641 [Arachis stenosperma]